MVIGPNWRHSTTSFSLTSKTAMTKLRRFLLESDGATAVEYAVMLALIIMACLGAITSVGQQTAALWGSNETGLLSAFNP